MITPITAAEIPPQTFNDPWHHVIQRCLLERPRNQMTCYTDGQGAYGIYESDMGFGYHNPNNTNVQAWAAWIADAKLPMLAGELKSHYQLLTTMGEILPAEGPVEVLCRYEQQDFCIHDGDLPGLESSPLRLKQAGPEDVDKLFHFYQKSETMQARSRESLLYTIVNNRLLYLQKLGKIVSAALTHCESSDAALIGGVYTPAMHRGKGYGYRCVHALLESLKAAGKTPTLFYEKNNEAARRLYRKLGFRDRGEWILIELTYRDRESEPDSELSPELSPEIQS